MLNISDAKLRWRKEIAARSNFFLSCLSLSPSKLASHVRVHACTCVYVCLILTVYHRIHARDYNITSVPRDVIDGGELAQNRRSLFNVRQLFIRLSFIRIARRCAVAAPNDGKRKCFPPGDNDSLHHVSTGTSRVAHGSPIRPLRPSYIQFHDCTMYKTANNYTT